MTLGPMQMYIRVDGVKQTRNIDYMEKNSTGFLESIPVLQPGEMIVYRIGGIEIIKANNGE